MTQPMDSWTTSTRIELVMWNGERFVYFLSLLIVAGKLAINTVQFNSRKVYVFKLDHYFYDAKTRFSYFRNIIRQIV